MRLQPTTLRVLTTQRKNAEKALRMSKMALEHSRQERDTLTAKLFAAQEEERRRIARDLHDDFNQRLADLAFDVKALERKWPSSLESIQQQLQSVHQKVIQLSDDIHDLAYELHPSLLDDVGLEAAVRDQLATFSKRTHIQIVCAIRQVPRSLPGSLAGALYRIVQESLHNVTKHAKATQVIVRLSWSERGIGLSVTDNGIGFNPSLMKTSHGLGLQSMQERARLLGGTFTVRSRPGAGTQIRVWIPQGHETI